MKQNRSKQKLRIAICEDDPRDSGAIEDAVRSVADCDVDSYESGEDLLSVFNVGMYDIIFFDVYMSGITGVETAKAVREKDESCEIVFTTASRDHMLDGYELSALHYLVKPVEEKGVSEVIRRVRNKRKLHAEQSLTVKKARRNVSVEHQDIFYAEIYNKECQLHTTDGVIKTNTTIDELEEKLPCPPFLRCHRSYIVNMQYIADLQKDFILKNGDVVYIRQSDARHIKKQYMNFLIGEARNEDEF